MIKSTNAIVLHQLKYSESSVIVTLYTEEFGRQSYMINGIRSPKSRAKMGVLQPLFLLEIQAYHKGGRDVQRMKEFKATSIYNDIPFNIVKSTMAMFLAEMLNKVLRSEEADASVFEFMQNAFVYFDSMESGSANFHLWFLTKMLGYLGFQLENNHSNLNVFFDMKAGAFVPQRPSFPNTPNTEESKFLAQLIDLEIQRIDDLAIDGITRSRLLTVILEYYAIHFDGLGSINSLKVLQEIFH